MSLIMLQFIGLIKTIFVVILAFRFDDNLIQCCQKS